MQRDIEKGLKAGFFRYITKPIRINEFTEALNEALKFAEKGAHLTNLVESIK
jgi:CheY-like chemotaxis protein